MIRELIFGPYPSFAMLAGMELDLFTPLAGGARSAAQIATALNVREDRLGPLLYALVAAGLLTVDEATGQFANTEETERLLVKGSPNYVGDVRELLADLWGAALRTAESIRTGAPVAQHDYSRMPREQLRSFFRGLFPGALATGRALAARFDLSSRRSLIDLGAGSGGTAIAITEACPALHATVVDLPTVAPIAREFIDGAGADDRVSVLACDVLTTPLEGSYDIAVLSAFIQTLGRDDIPKALSNLAGVMQPGGLVLITGSGIVDDARTTPTYAATFNIVFLNVYDEAVAYTESEYRSWLEGAGFEGFQRVLQPDGSSVLTATRAN